MPRDRILTAADEIVNAGHRFLAVSGGGGFRCFFVFSFYFYVFSIVLFLFRNEMYVAVYTVVVVSHPRYG